MTPATSLLKNHKSFSKYVLIALKDFILMPHSALRETDDIAARRPSRTATTPTPFPHGQGVPMRSRTSRGLRRLAIGATMLLGLGGAGMAAAGFAESAGAADLTVTVSGNELLRGGAEIALNGVNRMGTEYACIQDWGIFDGPSDQASVDVIATWGARVVRVPLNADCWNPKSSTPKTYTGEVYRTAIRDYVAKVNNAGMSVILDLHWTSRGPDGKATEQDYMPETGNAYDFWHSVADTFKNNRSVLFELFNEPRDVSPACWRDGCTFDGYRTAGMQEMLNAVRDTGAENVVIATGLGWGNYIGHWLANRPSDPKNQLVAGFHVYNFSGCNSRSCYDGDVAAVSRSVPVLTTELGQDDDQDWFIRDYAGWAADKNVSYLFWAWTTGGVPHLLKNYDGTPTNYGAGARAILQSQGGTNGGGTSAVSRIRGEASGKCLDVDDGKTADGTRVQIWTCDSGTDNQKWDVRSDGSVRALGKCLDVVDRGTANGSGLQLWTCDGGDHQRWEFTTAGQLRHPSSGRCLDVRENDTADGATLQIWDCHSGGNQRWARV